MSLRVLTLLLSIVALSLTAASVWIIRLLWGGPFLVKFFGVTELNFLLGGVFWLVYTTYAMHRLVPKVDAIVDPVLRERLLIRGDLTFYRLYRLILYGGSAGCRRCNRRVHNGRSQPEFDFRRLPSNLRIPLALHFHAMWLLCVFMFSGAGALKLAEMWGLIGIH